MSTYYDVEGAEHAARRLESAASESTRAADRLDDAINRLTLLVGSGYGNVAERLLEALEKKQQEPAESATPAVTEESSATRTPGLRSDNPLAAPVMGGLPRYDGGKLSTPGKHPDTERLDWLERAESGEARRCLAYNNLRAAIDAARKQGGSAHD